MRPDKTSIVQNHRIRRSRVWRFTISATPTAHLSMSILWASLLRTMVFLIRKCFYFFLRRRLLWFLLILYYFPADNWYHLALLSNWQQRNKRLLLVGAVLTWKMNNLKMTRELKHTNDAWKRTLEGRIHNLSTLSSVRAASSTPSCSTEKAKSSLLVTVCKGS